MKQKEKEDEIKQNENETRSSADKYFPKDFFS